MKKALKKTWIFIKKYWYIFAIVVGFVLTVLFGRNKEVAKLFDLIEQEREIANKERELIELTEKNIEKEIEKNTKEYEEKDQKLDDAYNEKVKEIEKQKRETEKEIVSKIRENPEKTLKEIAEEMGWTYE